MKYTKEQLNELIADFKDYMSGFRSENTATAYSRDANNFMVQVHRDTENINRESIGKYVKYGKMEKGTKRGAAASQVRRRASIKAFLDYMHVENPEADEHLDASITDGVMVAPLKKRLPECLTVEEMERLIESLGTTESPVDIRNRAMLELMYCGGLRVSELLDLNVGQVNASDYVNSYLRIVGKGDKERIVIMSKTAAKWVHKYLDVARPQFTEDKSTWLFVSYTGKKLSINVVWEFLREAAQKAGIPIEKVHPHVIRHSFATHMLQGGANLMTIKELMGHASIATTQVYLTVMNREKATEFAKAFPRQ